MILTDSKEIASSLTQTAFVQYNQLLKHEGNLDVIIIVGSRKFVSRCQTINFPNLKFVQLLSAGYEGIDIGEFRKKGIVISNAGDIYGPGMAEFVVFAMLMSAKRYNRRIQRFNRIRYSRGYSYISELLGKTVGILGTGVIGSEVAKRLTGFDMTILGYDNLLAHKPNFNKIFHPSEMNEFLAQCDYLVFALPLNSETEGLIDKSFFDRMKENVTIVNVSRISLFNKSHLFNALKQNKNMTAILDMYEIFPNPITNPFRRLPNVMVLPGVTAISKEINKRRNELVRENISLIQANKLPKFVLR